MCASRGMQAVSAARSSSSANQPTGSPPPSSPVTNATADTGSTARTC